MIQRAPSEEKHAESELVFAPPRGACTLVERSGTGHEFEEKGLAAGSSHVETSGLETGSLSSGCMVLESSAAEPRPAGRRLAVEKKLDFEAIGSEPVPPRSECIVLEKLNAEPLPDEKRLAEAFGLEPEPPSFAHALLSESHSRRLIGDILPARNYSLEPEPRRSEQYFRTFRQSSSFQRYDQW